MKKLLALLLVIITVFSVLNAGLISVDAVNSIDKFSTQYKSSVYYTNLMKVRNNTALSTKQKLIEVAKSQVGYKSGTTKKDLNGLLPSGKSGSVCEYNLWFNNGSDSSALFESQGAWCAAFTSWCFAQAGVPKKKFYNYSKGVGDIYKGILGKEKETGKIIKNAVDIGMVVQEKDALPGDIVFFTCPKNDTHNKKYYCHIGIVTDKDKDGTLYVVDGNSANSVNKGKAKDKRGYCETCKKDTVVREYLRIAFCNHPKTYSKVTKAATCTAAGVRTHYCSDCNYQLKTESIPVIKHKYDKYHHCYVCGNPYPCEKVSVTKGVYRTKEKTTVHSTAYSKKKGGASNTIDTLAKGTAVTVTAKYKNKPGNYWYGVSYVNSKGKTVTGMIYSKRLSLYQKEFKVYESSKRIGTIKIGSTLTVPTSSKAKKSGYVVDGFTFRKLNSKKVNEYLIKETGTWMTESQRKAKGYTYKVFKPGEKISFNETMTNASNKYTTKYGFEPKWAKDVTYTVKYDANKGTGAPKSQTKKTNQKLVLSTVVPERYGYTFMGWSTVKDGKVVNQPGGTYSANANVTFFAVWEKDPITWKTVYVQDITQTSAKVGCTVTAEASKLSKIGLEMKELGGSWKSVASWNVDSKLDYCTVQCGGKNAEAPALKSNTSYSYRFYVVSKNNKYYYSDTKSFATLKPAVDSTSSPSNISVIVDSPITFDTLYVQNITQTSAKIGCTVTADCSKLSKIGLQLKTSGGAWKSVASWTVGNKLEYCTVQCGGSNAEAAALTSNTTYSYRFYVTAKDGKSYYSDEKSFTTLKAAATETSPITWKTVYVQNITQTSAKIGCTVTANCSKIKKIGLQLKTSGGSWKSVASWSVGNKLDYCTVQCGGKNAEAAALTKNTSYSYRFYIVTTSNNTFYSPTKTFQTLK